MKKILALTLTLILALGMTATAFAADGKAGLTWTENPGGGVIIPIDPDPPLPPGFGDFLNPDFEFGEVEISYAEDKEPSSTDKAGVVVEGYSGGWHLTAKIGAFYNQDDTTDTTSYMNGFELYFINPSQITSPDGTTFSTAPVSSQPKIMAPSSPTAPNHLGTASAKLAAGESGLFGMNWTGKLKIPAASRKTAGNVSAILEWTLGSGV